VTTKPLAFAAAIATLAFASTARAESVQCDHAALARAEAAVLDAQARYQVAQGWGAQNRAIALVAAAGEQLRTAKALCDVTPATEDAPKVSPFDSDADPFAPVAHLPTEPLELDPDTVAYLLVCGDVPIEECMGLAVEAKPEFRHDRW
jgi:hypothetical protein